MSLKRSMPMILREYTKMEKEVSVRGQKKIRITREEIHDKRLVLPLEDEKCRTIIAFGVLNFTMRIEQAIDEIYRVLKPGGKLAIAVWTKAGRDYKNGVFYFAGRQFFKSLGRFKSILYRELYSDGERTLRAFIGEK